ncbi:hypothetical protein OQA88_712 [Cercophora sp. LCS_1]
MFSLPTRTPSELRALFPDLENPTHSEVVAAGYRTFPGKQCGHPANELFRDPRPNPPSLRSRKAILSSIFRDHGLLDDRSTLLLEHYAVPPDEEEVDVAASFPQFTQLPFEIREYIWQLALPSRILDIREIRHDRGYLYVRGAALPVPLTARVCREAREVVMRLGHRLKLCWAYDDRRFNPGPNSGGTLEVLPAGFFLKGKDVVLRFPDPSTVYDPAEQDVQTLQSVDPSFLTLSANGVLSQMNCDSVALNWTPPTRRPNTRAEPGSKIIYPWNTCKTLPPNVRTVYICYRSRFIDVYLGVAPKFFVAAKQDKYGGVEAQLMVDLYNDQRLAELTRLDTIQGDRDRTEPRFAAPDIRNPGLCINCERVQWETYLKPQVISNWLQLFEDELDEVTYPNIFPADAELGYNPDHPWVKEKLAHAPQFRPAVMVHLQVEQVNNEEESDYNRRVVALR